MAANNSHDQQPSYTSPLGRMADDLKESLKLLKKLSIEDSNTTLNFSMLREQTLGTLRQPQILPASTDLSIANVNVILLLYIKDGDKVGCSEPTIITARRGEQVYAAAVRIRTSKIETLFEGPECVSDLEALAGLYELSKDAIERAHALSLTARGFQDWDKLDLPQREPLDLLG